MRRLLQLDPPAPERSDDDLVAEAEANYRWNFTVNLLDGAWFWFGLSFISSTTILPLFVSKVSTNPFWLALLAMLSQAAWYLPQLFAADATERLDRKKPVVVNLGLFTERLPVWLLPVAALMAPTYPTTALVIFFVAYAWHGLGAGAIAPAWSDMLARCFPVNRRGRMFGLTNFIGTGLGILGAGFSSWLLANYAFPTNFTVSFALAAAAISISWVFIAMTREPVRRLPRQHRTVAHTPRSKIMGIVRTDHNFRQFLFSRLLANLGRMGTGFLTVAAITRWGVPDSTVGIFTAVLLLGQTGGNLLAGLVADRHGHKLTLEIGQAVTVLAFALAWLAPTPTWFYVMFFFTGMGQGISIVSSILGVMEYSPPELRPTYVGLGNTVSGVGSVIAPLLGGLLASVSYGWLFAASMLVSCVAWAILSFGVLEPRNQIRQPDSVRA